MRETPESAAAEHEALLAEARRSLFRAKLQEIEEGATEELSALHREIRRRAYAQDPTLWANRRLGDTLWTGQSRILNALRDHRRVAVKSAHEVGKSFIAADAAAWWLDTNLPGTAFVVTSAPSNPQVKAILWREIGRVHARGSLRGRVNQTEWYMQGKAGNEELVAMGRKPDEYDPTAFQGIHAPKVLVIFDEANGIRGPLWEAADSLIANDNSKILLISNPDDPTGEYFDACKPGSGYHVISISAFDSPNFTGEDVPKHILDQLIGRIYVEEKRAKWAPHWTWTSDGRNCVPPTDPSLTKSTNPYWWSKVMGEFPENSEAGALIPLSWIRAAQQRVIAPEGAGVLSLDVGGGADDSTCGHNRNGHFRILWSNNDPDTMRVCGEFVATLKQLNPIIGNVDKNGIGVGVFNRTQELFDNDELLVPTEGINVGEKADDGDSYVNLRAELYWNMRSLFEAGLIDIDPLDEDLAAELASVQYERLSNGKIQIESKKAAKARGIPSPNRADCLMLSCVPKPRMQRLTWGRRRAS